MRGLGKYAGGYQESKAYLKKTQEVGTLMNSDPNSEELFWSPTHDPPPLILAQVLDLFVLTFWHGKHKVEDVQLSEVGQVMGTGSWYS